MSSSNSGDSDNRSDRPDPQQSTASPPPSRPPSGDSPQPRPTGSGGGRGGQGNRLTEPSFPHDLVQVTAWPDPVLDRLGHDPRSGYVEQYWLSILGPSCLLLLRRLAAELERAPEGFDLNTVQWASELGIGMKGGKNGPFWRAVERGCRFGAARRNGGKLAVRRRLPPLTARQVERLPSRLQVAHEQWTEARLQRPRRPTVVKWSPHRDDLRPEGSHRPGDEPTAANHQVQPLDDAA